MIRFIFIFLFAFIASKAQDKTLDSLRNELKNAKHDTTRLKIRADIGELFSIMRPGYWDSIAKDCQRHINAASNSKAELLVFKQILAASNNNLGYMYNEQGDIAKALEYYEKSMQMENEIGNKEGVASSLNNFGTIYQSQGNIHKALEYYGQSFKLLEELGNKEWMALSLNNIGNIYKSQGDIPKALENYSKSLKLLEEIGDKSGIASAFNNIGNIYKDQGDVTKAIECNQKSLKLREELNDKRGTAESLNNIGNIYSLQKKADKAIEFYNRSLKISEEIGYKKGVGASLLNIGFIYENSGDFPVALEYYKKSLRIREEIEDKNGVTYSLNSIGSAYFKQKKYAEALANCNKSLKISKEMGFPENIKNSARLLWQIYEATNNYKMALENHVLFIQMKDSINNVATQKATIKQQTRYEYEKQKAVADEKHLADLKQQEMKAMAEKKRQNIIIGSVSIVLLLVAVFLVILFNRFRVTQRQKNIIEIKEKETLEQKHLIEEKHKEITDSINYAERIQKSFLATKSHLDSHLTEYFILFKPKDVVSGDFYWSATLNNGFFAMATADSTGHGVPGAIMSLLNITSLEKAIESFTEPSDILNATRKIIIERLKKDGSAEGGKDGMDCSLCVYDLKKLKLFISAANNPVWIVRGHSQVIEIKPDKMPVGKHDKQNVSFTNHLFDLEKGDVVYTLTDGFPDQFGGEKGKKFMSKNLRELLTANSHLPMDMQKNILETTFKNWVGSLEQVDDVTVIGIKV